MHDAKAEYVSSHNLHVSSNVFGGPMVLQIVVDDPNLSSVNDPEAEPHVTFGGHELRMVQGVDGNWYAYVGHDDNIYDLNAVSTPAGEGLNFGTDCTDVANNLILGEFDAGTGVLVNNANCPASRPDTSTTTNPNDVMNVIRDEKSPSNNDVDDLDATINRGQVGLLADYWPFIQTFPFLDNSRIPLVYHGGVVLHTIDVKFDDDMDEYAEFSLDNDLYLYNTNVLLTINDNQLNIDPTDDDVWTFQTTRDGDSYYHVFDYRGDVKSTNPVNYRDHLADAGVNSKLGHLVIDTNPYDLGEFLKFRDNSVQDIDAISDYAEGDPLVTVRETGVNSGVFTNDDSAFVTNLYTTGDESTEILSSIISYNDYSLNISWDHRIVFVPIPGQIIFDPPSTGEFYTWTDIVGITVVAPDNNSDSNVEEDVMITMVTNKGAIIDYVLKETGADTGNFTGMVTLTGFEYDVDGDGTYDAPTRAGISSGTGPTGGFVQADGIGGSGIRVIFDYSGETLENSIDIKWNNGTVSWDKSDYDSTETATLRITDPDMNLNPDLTDTFKVNVTSGSDIIGIALNVTETGDVSGIFEGMVDFTDTGSSSGSTLLISANDTITGNYVDRTTREGPDIQSMNATASISIVEPVPQQSTSEVAIILNKENYTWTDRVKIIVTAPDGNSTAADELLVKVSTDRGSLDQYKLTESGANTGNFTGEITLTGFKYNADGEDDDDAPTRDGTLGGTGPTGGYLQAGKADTITVSFINNGNNITASAPIGWTLGTVKWLDANYTVFGSGIFEITDPDLNLKPDTVDEFKVKFNASSNSYFRELNAKETGESTGVFQVTVPFTLEKGKSGKLTVESNATITGIYRDHTLPVSERANQKTLNATKIIEIYTETNSTDTETNSTDTKPEEKKPADPPKTTKPADKPTKPAEPKQKTAEPKKTTPEPRDEPAPEPEPAAPVVAAPIPTPAVPEPDPEPGVDPEPGFDLTAEPVCGPGTELVGDVCQAIEVQPENFDIIDWLFSLFQR